MDGLRGDLLQNLLSGSSPDYPNFRRLRDEGASTFNARCDFNFSETLPNHCSVVTGRPVNNPPGAQGIGHGYNINGYSPGGGNIHKLGAAVNSYKVSVFDTAHDRGLTTALYAGKTRLNVVADSYNTANGRPDPVGEDNGKRKIDFTFVQDLASAVELGRIQKAVVADIKAPPPGGLRNYSLIHITDTDTGTAGGGHSAGWGSPAWNRAVADVDRYLGLILGALDADPVLKKSTAVVLTSDHGGGGPSSPGSFGTSHTDATNPMNYTIPLFLWGGGIPAGTDAYALFGNRGDPGSGRPESTAPAQPLRNADTANVAMRLLGLPEVEGSYFRPEFAATPEVTKGEGGFTIRWPAYLTKYRLESAADPAAGEWTVVEGTPAEGDRRCSENGHPGDGGAPPVLASAGSGVIRLFLRETLKKFWRRGGKKGTLPPRPPESDPGR